MFIHKNFLNMFQTVTFDTGLKLNTPLTESLNLKYSKNISFGNFYCFIFFPFATFPSATWSIYQTKFPSRVCWKSYVFLMKRTRNLCWKSVEENDKSCVKLCLKLCVPDNLRKMSEPAVHPWPHFLCYAATSPWCCSRDQRVVQERKGFLTPTIFLLWYRYFT